MKIRSWFLALCISLSAIAALAHGGEEHVMGMVTAVSDKAITVKTAKAPVTVNVGPATTFLKGKAPAKLGDLKVGDRVVIHAKEGTGDQLVADTVEFAAPPAAAKKSSAGAKKGT